MATNDNNVPAAAELVHFHASAVSLLQNNIIYVNFSTPGAARMAEERQDLLKHGWYWGPITLAAAQRKLKGRPNGSFLVRDSHSSPFLFSISFRSANCTLHTRVNHLGGYWTIFADRRCRTMVDLIEDTMQEKGVLCYAPSPTKLGPDFPIQLHFPVSRFVQSSLQHLCRLYIRNHLVEAIQRPIDDLPLPKRILEYLKEANYDLI